MCGKESRKQEQESIIHNNEHTRQDKYMFIHGNLTKADD